jgi:leader peptidase (prepilin peptidase)/N-methyltransferase
MDVGLVIACLALGVVVGALSNVAVHRIPANVALAWPPRPDRLRLALAAPLLGRRWPGRGAHALVELGMGFAFAAVAARIGWDWALPAFLLFTWTLLVIAVIDANIRKIPNRLTYPLIPTLAGLLLLSGLLTGEPWWGLRALLGGLIAFATLLLMAVARPHSMGMGDVKLAAFIGLGLGYLGWAHVFLGVTSAFLLGGLVATVLLLSRRRGRRDLLPFGPYLAAGALVSVLAGGPLLDGYQSLAAAASLLV